MPDDPRLDAQGEKRLLIARTAGTVLSVAGGIAGAVYGQRKHHPVIGFVVGSGAGTIIGLVVTVVVTLNEAARVQRERASARAPEVTPTNATQAPAGTARP